MANKRITDLTQISQLTDTTKFYAGEQIKDFNCTFAQIKTALGAQSVEDRLQLLEDNLIGTIQIFASNTLTTDFLTCDGAEYLKTDYPKLYAKIGDVFGSGSYPTPTDNTKFRVPNLLDYFIRNTDGTREVGVKQEDTMQKITGDITSVQHRGAGASGVFTVSAGSRNQAVSSGSDIGTATFSFDSSKQTRVSAETRPKNVTLFFGIKAQ